MRETYFQVKLELTIYVNTNDFSNLMLIKNDPYHKSLTVYQNSFSRGMKIGQIKDIKFPVFEGKIYSQ